MDSFWPNRGSTPLASTIFSNSALLRRPCFCDIHFDPLNLNDCMNGFSRTFSIPALSITLILSGCASQEQKNPTDAAGQVRLGDMYTKGTWTITQNDETAADWYRKAALQGDAAGQYRLGVCYEWGIGVPKNDLLALEWYTKAAHGSNQMAQYELGTFYRLGKGVKPDLIKAYLWFNLSAASGNTNAREARNAVAHRLTADEIRQAEHLSRVEWDRCQ